MTKNVCDLFILNTTSATDGGAAERLNPADVVHEGRFLFFYDLRRRRRGSVPTVSTGTCMTSKNKSTRTAA